MLTIHSNPEEPTGRYLRGSDSGTTAAIEAIAATILNGSGAVIKIKNPTASMYYRIDVHSDNDDICLPDPVLAWTLIPANTLLKDTTSLAEPYAKALVYVKEGSAAGAYTITASQYSFD
jgi:hypothetical protein